MTRAVFRSGFVWRVVDQKWDGPKIRTVRENASFVRQVKAEHGSFAKWIADWPTTDIVGLWAELRARGSRLGGNTGPMMLRQMGRDTFLITRDTTAALVAEGVVDKAPTGKGALAKVQAAMNGWHEETGRPLCQLSRILALSVN